MCQKPEEAISTPPGLQTNMTVSYTLNGDWNDASTQQSTAEVIRSRVINNPQKESYNKLSYWMIPTTFAGLSLAAGMLGLGLWLPFVSIPEASTYTYKFAFWSYDKAQSHFDNTAWTYGTDYFLAMVMAAFSYSILRSSRRGVSDRLATRSASLVLLYMISVTSGGIAHQNFTTVESRNTLAFRLLWTLCVGTVSLACTSMGLCGTEIVRKFQSESLSSPIFDKIPRIPEFFWWVYGVCVAAFTAWGGMSFQRPACDIFIAGTAQAPPTFYIMALLQFLECKNLKIEYRYRLIGLIGFILNAPLLPVYSVLVYYTDWSLGAVNTLLHSCLCVAWSMQGYCLQHVIQSLDRKLPKGKIL
jgi:hypothetical protein